MTHTTRTPAEQFLDTIRTVGDDQVGGLVEQREHGWHAALYIGAPHPTKKAALDAAMTLHAALTTALDATPEATR